jgi:formyl-CoA transferase
VIGGNTDAIYRRLMTTIGRSDLAADERFRDNIGRAEYSDLLDGAIAAWTSDKPLSVALASLEAAHVPAGPIYAAPDIASDPQFIAREMILEMDVEVEPGSSESVQFPGVVPRLEQMPGRVGWLGPELGQHTDEILSNMLSLNRDEIAALRAEKVV